MSAKASSARSARASIHRLAVGVLVELAAIAGLSAPADLNWTSYGGSPDSSRYFNSKQITKANVAGLEAVWTYPYGEAVFHPLIVHNTIYTRGRRPPKRAP